MHIGGVRLRPGGFEGFGLETVEGEELVAVVASVPFAGG